MAPPEASESEPELRDYLVVLRRRKGVIFAAVALTVLAALVVSFLQTPVYRGTAEILLQTRGTDSLFNNMPVRLVDPTRAVQTEIRILRSEPVRAAVREKLGSAPAVSANGVGQTDVIQVSAEHTQPGSAAEIANAYATSYIDFRRKQAVDDTLAASQEIQAKIADLQREIDQAPADRRETLLEAQAVFSQKLDQLQVDSALKTGGAQLVTPAAVPSSPVKPRPLRNAMLALVLGLLLGVGLAFLVDYLDDSVKTKEDFNRVAPDVPVIGLIPALSSWRSKGDAVLVSVSDPTSAAAEAYRTLRTGVQFTRLDRPMRTLQVTSANATEGKTTTLANLAVALARAGERVVVVCCDLRRPRVHEFFGLTNEVGFTSVLLGKKPLSGALQEVPGQPRLQLLASGPLPPNPSELLSSKRTVEVLTSLQGDTDIVLLDCPPVLPVTDALVLSGRVDATLLVAVAGATARAEVARTVELLRQVDAPLVGAVLNGVTDEGSYGYGYQYRRDPSADARQTPKKQTPKKKPAKKLETSKKR